LQGQFGLEGSGGQRDERYRSLGSVARCECSINIDGMWTTILLAKLGQRRFQHLDSLQKVEHLKSECPLHRCDDLGSRLPRAACRLHLGNP
jgi:hypothetical protein